jgi:putative Ca2+/H+ antiporter (TMEM165/GDT1 family)
MDGGAGRSEYSIPVTVTIGVSGQRTLCDEALVREGIRKVLSRLDRILSHSRHQYLALTSLSEGSDRLLASEVLAWPSRGQAISSELELILPVGTESYIRECATEHSMQECRSFISSAASVQVIERKGQRDVVCEEIGHTIVHRCDVLVVIWNGSPPAMRGSTAEMVKYARMVGRTLFWIHSENGKITEERHGDGILESFEYLDSYNAEHVDREEVERRVEERFLRFVTKARMFGLDHEILTPLRNTLLPYFIYASVLNRRYERRYMFAGAAVYALATAAIATVTLQVLFFPAFPSILWIEVFLIAAVLFLIALSQAGDWHRRWIDYRFLTERLRTAMFLSVFCVQVEQSTTPPHLSLSHSPNDWLARVFNEMLKKRPLEYCRIDLPFVPLRNFLLTAWIDDQISFYSRSSTWNRQRFHLLSEIGDLFFTVTLILAAVHALNLEHGMTIGPVPVSGLLAAMTIIFPSVGAALSAIRVKREYLRNSERYAHMVRHLSVIGAQIKRCEDLTALIDILHEANEITLREQQDWRVVFRFRELEPP